MSSATDILATMEVAADDLESLTAVFKRSIVPPRGGDFDLLQAIWETQKRLSEACKAAAKLNGPEADVLWKRVGAVRQETQEVLAISKRFHESWKRHQPSGNGQPRENGHRASGPEPTLSIPEYLGKERPSAAPERAKRDAARRARQLARSGPKGGFAAPKSGDGKGKRSGKARR